MTTNESSKFEAVWQKLLELQTQLENLTDVTQRIAKYLDLNENFSFTPIVSRNDFFEVEKKIKTDKQFTKTLVK